MKKIIFSLLILPFIYLTVELFIIQEVNDPIKYIYTFTGISAIVILFFTTTISMWFKKLTKHRRMIGLFGFFYVLLHMLNFVILDMEIDIIFAIEETLDKPFIYLGMTSFLLLLFMAITSTKKLFRKYNKYHKVLYIVFILTTIHFVMAQKSLSIEQYFYLLAILTIGLFKMKQYTKKKRKKS